MQTVITTKQAKQITGGRTPLVPVQYETAVKALAECIVLDDAKTWSDKADALAAWAKIYRDDKVGRQAKALKLEAFRRMGQIADELRPKKVLLREKSYGHGTLKGTLPGGRSLLLEAGLTETNSAAALKLGRATRDEFENILQRPSIPSPVRAASQFFYNHNVSVSWAQFTGETDSPRRLVQFARRHPAREFAMAFTAEEADKARPNLREMMEWLDEVDRHLPSK